jgi:hypothetical protein
MIISLFILLTDRLIAFGAGYSWIVSSNHHLAAAGWRTDG